jgi:cysteine desulfurase
MQEFSKVYLDFNATTPLSAKVRDKVTESLAIWGNPSSIHWAGREIKMRLREARQNLAISLGTGPLELIFTSGASESSNTVIQGLFNLQKTGELPAAMAHRTEFITSQVEHPSVMKAFDQLEKQGACVHRIAVSREGVFDMDAFTKALGPKTLLVSVMFANNETGNLLPLPQIVELSKAKGALVHTDAVQALGKTEINLGKLGVDYASLSGHKFYALKGTGLLYAKRGAPFRNLILGGAQERSRRGGTENTLGQIAFGEAIKDLSQLSIQSSRIRELRDRMEARILSEIPNVTRTASGSCRLSNTSSLIIKGADGETMLMSLDLKGFAVSTGAACSSGSPEPSPVLLAMGLTKAEAQNSLRVSLGWTTTEAEVMAFVDALKAVVQRLREVASSQSQNPNPSSASLIGVCP